MSFATSAGSADGQCSLLVQPLVPPHSTIAILQADREAAAAAAAAATGSLPSSPIATSTLIAPAAPAPPTRYSLSRYSDSDLLLHPLLQKVLDVYLQQEKPPQHELLEFWRDSVNFRTGFNRAQLSPSEEATILHRAYILPSANKFMKNLSPSIQQAISAAVIRCPNGVVGDGSLDRYLFLDAERSTEHAICSGPLLRFKASMSFSKIAPFVKIDPKMLRKNEQTRKNLTTMRDMEREAKAAAAAAKAAAAAATIAASASSFSSTSSEPSSPQSKHTGHRLECGYAQGEMTHEANLHPRGHSRFQRANSLPDYVHLKQSEEEAAAAAAEEAGNNAAIQKAQEDRLESHRLNDLKLAAADIAEYGDPAVIAAPENAYEHAATSSSSSPPSFSSSSSTSSSSSSSNGSSNHNGSRLRRSVTDPSGSHSAAEGALVAAGRYSTSEDDLGIKR